MFGGTLLHAMCARVTGNNLPPVFSAFAVRQAISSPDVVASVRSCCGGNEADAWMVLSQWERVILTLVTRAVCSVEPPTQERASTDLLQFVKVKTVPGGVSTASITGSGITTAGDSSKLAEVLAAVLPGDCEYINGVMFRKILPHKLMREDIVRPKVLLLDGMCATHTTVPCPLSLLWVPVL